MANENCKTPGDRELLEMAAKAAGLVGVWSDYYCAMEIPSKPGGKLDWNPIAGDSDEARLESVLGLDVEWHLNSVEVGECIEQFINHNSDKQAARRRAGTRAAAAIGAAK